MCIRDRDYIAFRDIDKDFLSNFVDFLKQAKKASKYGLAKAGGCLLYTSVSDALSGLLISWLHFQLLHSDYCIKSGR